MKQADALKTQISFGEVVTHHRGCSVSCFLTVIVKPVCSQQALLRRFLAEAHPYH